MMLSSFEIFYDTLTNPVGKCLAIVRYDKSFTVLFILDIT